MLCDMRKIWDMHRDVKYNAKQKTKYEKGYEKKHERRYGESNKKKTCKVRFFKDMEFKQ